QKISNPYGLRPKISINSTSSQYSQFAIAAYDSIVPFESFRATLTYFTSHCRIGSYRKFKLMTEIAKINRLQPKISINSTSSQYSRFAIAAYDSIASFASFGATLTYSTSHCHMN